MSTEAKIEINVEVTAGDRGPYLRGLFDDAEAARDGDSNDAEIEALWDFANEAIDELEHKPLRFSEPASNAEAQRIVETLMDRWNLRGLIWGELDLRARVDERLDDIDTGDRFTLPEGITREDVVKKAQEMPSWEKIAWSDGGDIPWATMADAVEEALRAICGKPQGS